MLSLLVVTASLLRPPLLSQQPHLDRRGALLAAAAAYLPIATPLPALALISATTMSGKTKPELGILLVDEAQQVGKTGVMANLVLADNVVAAISFDSVWPLTESGSYFDIEAKSRDGGDSAFVQVATAPKALGSLPKAYFTDTVLSTSGRYGSYGAPTDIKVISDSGDTGGTRVLEIAFTTLSPGSAEVPRKGVIVAKQPAGSKEVIFLTASTGASKWKKGGKEEGLKAAESFKVETRKSDLTYQPSSDYRYGQSAKNAAVMKSRNDGF